MLSRRCRLPCSCCLPPRDGLELDTRDNLDAAHPERLERFRDYFRAWVAA